MRCDCPCQTTRPSCFRVAFDLTNKLERACSVPFVNSEKVTSWESPFLGACHERTDLTYQQAGRNVDITGLPRCDRIPPANSATPGRARSYQCRFIYWCKSQQHIYVGHIHTSINHSRPRSLPTHPSRRQRRRDPQRRVDHEILRSQAPKVDRDRTTGGVLLVKYVQKMSISKLQTSDAGPARPWHRAAKPISG